MLDPSSYGEDRLFVYLHLADDENVEIDAHVERVRALGHPLIQLDLLDQYDLGSELYRWGFATAVAGAVLGIQPFDQPNVQQAKDLTDAVLQEYLDSGRIEEPQTELSPRGAEPELIAQHGQYLAIMAYMQPSARDGRSLYGAPSPRWRAISYRNDTRLRAPLPALDGPASTRVDRPTASSFR